jgi:Tfp pilus assembly protein FimV
MVSRFADTPETVRFPRGDDQGAVDSSEPPAQVQRDEEAAGAGAPAGAAAAAPGGAPGGAGGIDELANKLYDRIRSKLRAELRLDRERAGLVTDLRR